MTALNQFTWIPIYQELAAELAKWENRQEELISFLEDLRAQGYVITLLQDKDADGARFLLREIDPFTFFGAFNRRVMDLPAFSKVSVRSPRIRPSQLP